MLRKRLNTAHGTPGRQKDSEHPHALQAEQPAMLSKKLGPARGTPGRRKDSEHPHAVQAEQPAMLWKKTGPGARHARVSEGLRTP